MNLTVQEKDPAGLYDTPLLHQSYFWSQVKESQGYHTKAFDIKTPLSELNGKPGSSYVLDDILVQMIPVNRYQSIGYVPYGPVLNPDEERMGPFLEELSMSVKEKLPSQCLLLRYDLPWQSIWDDDVSLTTQNLRLNWGTNNKKLRKAVSNQLPSNTMFVNLLGSEEQILSRMHHKTRYNIRLAQRKGVEVRQVGRDHLDTFHSLYKETCERNRITSHDRSYFDALYSAEDEGAEIVLLMAFFDGQPLSAMFLSRSAHRATYLYGASSSQMRNSMSTYALQWHAIQLAKRWGCTEYDLFGVSPTVGMHHPMSGLYTFKKGFGGTIFQRMGCWDFAYDEEQASQLFAYEMVGEGYHLR
ncbi:lipid II:glycine glycyltransferase FemX [Sphaerochaeta sp.]|jgi:lipid II:glycine glycyltransferase (peptidoglycan interpeptide bridge formation enzyme)|uniref:lipid II:glycine glycyltransferase FemX n=1 Tax=Sphaerochaeta sp. TaxID=1972642 RepID=UPI003D13EE9B